MQGNSGKVHNSGGKTYIDNNRNLCIMVFRAIYASVIWQMRFLKEEKIMNASVAIQVLPTVTDDEEVIRIVDAVIDYIKSTGLSYYVGPCETSIEGDYDQLMEIVKNCQLVAAKAGCPAMHTYVKISYKPEGEVLTIDKKVTKHHQE